MWLVYVAHSADALKFSSEESNCTQNSQNCSIKSEIHLSTTINNLSRLIISELLFFFAVLISGISLNCILRVVL